MRSKSIGRLAGTLLVAAVIAGCGSSSSTSSSSTPAAATSTPAATTPASSTPAASTPSSTTFSPAEKAAVLAACKAPIAHAALSGSVKEKVEAICNKAASGDLAGARQAAKEVCSEIIKGSPIPSADKETALKACASAQ